MFAVLLSLVSGLSAHQAQVSSPPCKQARMAKRTVDAIEASSDDGDRVTQAAELQDKLRSVGTECSNSCQRAIAVQVARLLPFPTLRGWAALGLYRLGSNASAASREIHTAYLAQREWMRPKPDIPIRVGPDQSDLESLKCLDKFVNTGAHDRALCDWLEQAVKTPRD